MTYLTDRLTPLSSEGKGTVGDACTEEKERVRELENLSALLAVYFKGLCDTGNLFKVLKKAEEQGKQYILRDALDKLETSFMKYNLPFKFIEGRDGNIRVQPILAEEKK